MADEELDIDLSSMKKKKGKKTLDLSALEGEAMGSSASAGVTAVADDPELAEISAALMGKKKKKKATFNLDDLDSALPEGGEGNKENAHAGEAVAADEVDKAMVDDDLDFDLTKKKKKKKKVLIIEDMAEAGGGLGDDGGEDGVQFDEGPEGRSSNSGGLSSAATSNMPWLESDREYTYDDLINRVYGIIKEKNPAMVGEKKRLVMKPPQVLRVGTKKTSFANFLEICNSLHRQPKHMQQFLLAELGTSGSVDANNTLIIKGRFQQKQIENVLRRYIKEYVACQTCRSPETILQKDTRLFFLQCGTCGSRRSVASIKSGFQALTGKRAAMRAKGS